jgi:hypothetical protein
MVEDCEINNGHKQTFSTIKKRCNMQKQVGHNIIRWFQALFSLHLNDSKQYKMLMFNPNKEGSFKCPSTL